MTSSQRKGFGRKRTRGIESGFIGRETYLDLFRRNCESNAEDRSYRNIFAIDGQAGVGKTWLVRKYRSIAEEAKGVTALVDGEIHDAPRAMGAVAHQFRQQGHELKAFGKLYRRYLEKMKEVEADPKAPGGAALVGQVLGRVGLAATAVTPVGAVGGLVLEALPKESLVAYAADITAYLATKFRNRDDVRLVGEPVQVMTPVFLGDLMKLPRTAMLFFDSYELTADFLDRWLRDVLAGVYDAEMPEDMVLTIAGRYELGKGPRVGARKVGGYPWSEFHQHISSVSLEPFTEGEARDYLGRRGITDDPIVAEILRQSRCVPGLLNALAEESPADASSVGEPAGDAVDRILQWVNEPAKRQAAIHGAVSRHLNKDILARLVGEDAADQTFDWLTERPFVEDSSSGWVYDRVVRELMLQHQRRVSPGEWEEAHRNLAAYYSGRRDELGLEMSAGRRDEVWQGLDLERIYHVVCEAPRKNLNDAQRGFLLALDASHRYARRWAENVTEAGRDAGDDDASAWGAKLMDVLDADSAAEAEAALQTVSTLIDDANLDAATKIVALVSRSQLLRKCEKWDRALADMTEAVKLDDANASHYIDRAGLYDQLERYEDAIDDYGRALEIEPHSLSPTVLRSVSRFFAGHYQDAIGDLNAAVELSDADPRLYNLRAQLLIRLKRYEDALADLDRAEELGFEQRATLDVARAQTYVFMGRYPEALAVAERAEQDPGNIWALTLKSTVYQKLGDLSGMAETYAEIGAKGTQFVRELRGQVKGIPPEILQREMEHFGANMGMEPEQVERMISELRRLETLSEAEGQAILEADGFATKALNLGRQGKLDEALSAIDQALQLDEKPNSWFIRGLIRIAGEDPDGALDDFTKALQLDDRFAPALVYRGDTFLRMNRPEDAMRDYGRALELKPGAANVLIARGALLHRLQRDEEAIADFTRIIDEGLDLRALAFVRRGAVRSAHGEFELALRDLDDAQADEPASVMILHLRMDIHRRQQNFDLLDATLQEAEEVITRFVRDYHATLETSDELVAKGMATQWVLRQGIPPEILKRTLAETLLQLAEGPERATKLMVAELHVGNAEQHAALKQWEPALASFARAIDLAPEQWATRFQRAELLRRLKRYEEADAEFGEILAVTPENGIALAGRGESYRLQGRNDEAIADFDGAIAIDDAHRYAILSRGEALLAMGRAEEALADFDRCLEIGPADLYTLRCRAEARNALERYEEALDDVVKATELSPSDVQARYQRGEIYRLLRRFDDAVADLDFVIEQLPSLAPAWASRGHARFRLGQTEEGLADLDRAVELEGDNAWTRLERSEVYRLLGRWSDALADLDRVDEIDPQNDWSHYLRHLIHLARGDSVEASTHLEQAYKQGIKVHHKQPDNRRQMLNVALYDAAKGDAEEAEALVTKALDGNISPSVVQAAIDDFDDLSAIRPDDELPKVLLRQLSAAIG